MVALCRLMLLGALFALWLCRGWERPAQMPTPDLGSCQLLPLEGMVAMSNVLKMMVSYTLYLHLWCPKRASMNPDGERELAGLGCSCGSKGRQQRLKWHGREELGRLGMKCRDREWQVRAGKGWGRKQADSCSSGLNQCGELYWTGQREKGKSLLLFLAKQLNCSTSLPTGVKQ